MWWVCLGFVWLVLIYFIYLFVLVEFITQQQDGWMGEPHKAQYTVGFRIHKWCRPPPHTDMAMVEPL